MRSNVDFSPFYWSSIGFDRIFNLLENTGHLQGSSENGRLMAAPSAEISAQSLVYSTVQSYGSRSWRDHCWLKYMTAGVVIEGAVMKTT